MLIWHSKVSSTIDEDIWEFISQEIDPKRKYIISFKITSSIDPISSLFKFYLANSEESTCIARFKIIYNYIYSKKKKKPFLPRLLKVLFPNFFLIWDTSSKSLTRAFTSINLQVLQKSDIALKSHHLVIKYIKKNYNQEKYHASKYSAILEKVMNNNNQYNLKLSII